MRVHSHLWFAQNRSAKNQADSQNRFRECDSLQPTASPSTPHDWEYVNVRYELTIVLYSCSLNLNRLPRARGLIRGERGFDSASTVHASNFMLAVVADP